MAYFLNPSFIARYGVYNERKQNSINRSDSRKHRKQFLVCMNSVCILKYSKNVFLLSPMSGSIFFTRNNITQNHHKMQFSRSYSRPTQEIINTNNIKISEGSSPCSNRTLNYRGPSKGRKRQVSWPPENGSNLLRKH